ncbi:uncharacterized protein LOC113950476 [Corapipo altera]|uniref:uncharacterized protein LOC113950476 n=1 Tax=Corapipo altera TaxID=415028 RepID=UPI000FD671A4|nr:uncharacterized protein LOC113950476 [Corapipo altera]
MEKIILGRIEKHLKHNAVIRHNQYGFMRGKSFLLNLISFYDKPTTEGGEEKGGVREWLMVWRISVGALNWGVPFLNHDSPIESMPDGSRMDLPLAKAMLISDSGSTSRITKLNVEVEKPVQQKLQLEGGVRTCERNSPADTQVSTEGGAGGVPGTRVEISLQPIRKTMVKQTVPLQPMEVHGEAEIHLQPMLEQAVTLQEACTGAGSWQDLQTHGQEPTLEQICDPVVGMC